MRRNIFICFTLACMVSFLVYTRVAAQSMSEEELKARDEAAMRELKQETDEFNNYARKEELKGKEVIKKQQAQVSKQLEEQENIATEKDKSGEPEQKSE